MNKKGLLGLIVLAALIGAAAAIIYGMIRNTGSVVSLSFDPASIEWGAVTPGSSVTRTMNITNNGLLPTSALSLSVEWASEPCGSLTWNLEGVVLQPGEVREASFTLTLDSDAPVGTIDFNAVIGGI